MNRFMRLGKCWQANSPSIIWQLAPAASLREEYPKKFFLVIKTEQSGRGMFLVTEKPGKLNPSGAIVALLRKYVPPVWISAVLRDQSGGDLWIVACPGGSDEPVCYLRLTDGKPPELSLILADRTQLFRYGQKGTFTKRKSYDEELPEAGNARYRDVTEELLESFSRILRREDDSPADGEPEALQEEDSGGVSEEQRKARQQLARRLKTVRKSLEKQERALPDLSEVTLLKKKAAMLQTWAWKLAHDQTELKLEAHVTGEPGDIVIEVDPEQSAGQNIEKYFVMHKKQKKTLELGSARLEKIRREVADMEKDLSLLKEGEVPEGVPLEILRKYGLAREPLQAGAIKKQRRDGNSQGFKTFKGRDGELYLVGRGPSENDSLTRAARSDDFWVHVTGVTGSHVIIPRKNLKNGILHPAAKKDAMILALHFSKVRSDQAGEVYVTRRRHLRKQKGLPTGLWLVDKSETVFLKYTPEELRDVLSRQHLA